MENKTINNKQENTFSTKEKKWFTFNPLKITNFSSLMETKKDCECPITLKYYDDYAQANHFNLLLPQGNCCNVPRPENKPSSLVIDLDNVEQSYASAVKQSSKTCPSTKVSSTATNTTKQFPKLSPLNKQKETYQVQILQPKNHLQLVTVLILLDSHHKLLIIWAWPK